MDRVKLDIINNIKGIQENVAEIKDTLLPKKKQIISDRMIALITMIIAAIALVVSLYAMYTSNKLSTNNSALNFTYENITIKEPDPEQGIAVNTHDIYANQGTMELSIDINVISGQIESLYLVQKQNDEFIFSLLNNEGIQDHFSGTERYSLNIFLDMEKKAEYENIPIGTGQLYILSVDINGKISIDTIQIIGQIYQEFKNNTVMIYGVDAKYTFRYLKNNKLITLNGQDDFEDGWVNLSDKYLDIIGETDIKGIEEDITLIKEKYSKY